MLRRRRGASFMASAFVFPGGGVDPGESLEECAARELFEESSVALLAPREPGAAARAPELPALRSAFAADGVDALTRAGWRWDVGALQPWSHWITPSQEPKRFSAHFFVAALPDGQVPTFDDVETKEQTWVDPRDAEARAAELSLPPPQLRTLWELRELRSIEEVFAAGRARAAEPHPILPRMAPLSAEEQRPGGAPFALLLPWDPEYLTCGQGEVGAMSAPPSWATGPSRFVMEDRAWRHRVAPGSTSAG